MKAVRIYTGDDGRSHFEDFDIPLRPGQSGSFSRAFNAENVLFRETDADYALDFHCAPRRQFVVTLSGSAELEAGDGSRRILGPDTILFAEDTTGQGHISRAVQDPRITMFIPVRDDFDLERFRAAMS
jgi:hypothetical protein